jgi:2-phospho-L-lactate guanylyltransferase (CobY/MobA/RfbA family)
MFEVDAVVLAGSPPEQFEGNPQASSSRAMMVLGGKTMLQWTVDALVGSAAVSRIVAVGPVSADGLDGVVEAGGSIVENMKRGIDALGESAQRVLLVSSDIPLITSAGVDDFVERAAVLDVDFAYPIVRREVCDASYPQMKRTYLKTADGTFTGGNMTMVSRSFVRDNWDAVRAAYDARKQVSRLARIIGVGTLARVIIGQVFPFAVSIASLEAAASRALGAKVAAVISDFPEIAEDVDKESDKDAAAFVLASRVSN